MDCFDAAAEGRFRRRFFPGAGAREWNDAGWQLRNRLRGAAEVLRVLPDLEEEARRALERPETWRMPLALTPYMAGLLAAAGAGHPYRRTLIPDVREARRRPGEHSDPLGELPHQVAPGLVRAYPHKALLLATGECAAYCRYCTRSRLGGGERAMQGAMGVRAGRRSTPDNPRPACSLDLAAAVAYLRAHPEIDDVLISGGDPLVLDDARLAEIIDAVRSVPSVTFVRIGTKVPATLPQRITRSLARMLKERRPLWISTHFSHPLELTARACEGLWRLTDAGIPLMNQCVLLRGVNDDAETLRALFEGLIRNNVRPYYLHDADEAAGTGHFRTPRARGRALLREVARQTTGYAVPRYMADPWPGGMKHPLD